MPIVTVAESAGVCSGVRRALALIERLRARPGAGRLVSLGPLIHNRREMQRLAELGLQTISPSQLLPDDEVVVRTHGVAPAMLGELRGRVAVVHDATCPHVRSLQNLARRLAAQGYTLLVVGDGEHAELQAVLACARESAPPGASAQAVPTAGQLAGLLPLPGSKLAVLAQTTQRAETVREVLGLLLDQLGKGRAGAPRGAVELRTFDTICPEARRRQREARVLAGQADLVLVVGDRSSANARSLLELCQGVQPRSKLVEGGEEVLPAWLSGTARVAVVAGASTPIGTIQEVAARAAGDE